MAHMAGFAGRPPIRSLLAMTDGFTKEHLRKVCVPGAWLLDTVHTLVQAMHGRIQPNCQYVAVSNEALCELFNCCFPSVARAGMGASLNNRGNQVEALAWLVMEMDRMDLLLAMAFHLDVWTTGGGAACVQGAHGAQGDDAAMSSDTTITRDLDAYLARAAMAAAAHPTWPAQQAIPAAQQCQIEQPPYPPTAWCDSQGPHPEPHPGPSVEPATQGSTWESQRMCGASWNDWGTNAVSGVPFKPPPPLRQEHCRPHPGPPYTFSRLGKRPMGPPPYPAVPLPRQCFPG